MNGKNKQGESNREFDQQPDEGSRNGLPPYDFYQRGVADSQGGWLSSICQFLKDRSNSTVIVIAAIIALAYLAVVFVKSGNANYVKLIGGISLGIMIFTLGLSALLNIRWPNGTNTKKEQRGSVEPGFGRGSQETDGDAERPNERGEPD